MLQGRVTLTVSCLIVRVEEVFVMRHSVVAVFVEGTEELLQTLLDTVSLEGEIL